MCGSEGSGKLEKNNYWINVYILILKSGSKGNGKLKKNIIE